MVSVTLTWTSCESPVSSTVTEKPRSVRRGDRVLRVGGEHLVAGLRLHPVGHETRAVQAAGAAAAGGGRALEPLEDRLPVAGARVVRARDEARAGDGDAADPLALEHAAVPLRGRLEQIRPDHVARDQAGGGRLQEPERVARHVLRRRGRLAEALGEAAQPADPELERLDRLLVLLPQRARRVDPAHRRDVLLLALREAGQLRVELAELDPLRRQRVVQLPADLVGCLRDIRRPSRSSSCTSSSCPRPGSSRSRRRGGRRSGSRRRSGPPAAGAASSPSGRCAVGGRRGGRHRRRRPSRAGARARARPPRRRSAQAARRRRSRNRDRRRVRTWVFAGNFGQG